MTKQEYREVWYSLAEAAGFIMGVIIMLVISAVMNGCKMQRCVPQTEYVQRDSIVMRLQIDSVRVIEKDSVFIDKGRGDTVWLTRWKYIEREHITNKTDTLYLTKTDKLVQTETVRYVPKYYKVCSWIVWMLFVVLCLRFAWWAVKKYYLRR